MLKGRKIVCSNVSSWVRRTLNTTAGGIEKDPRSEEYGLIAKGEGEFERMINTAKAKQQLDLSDKPNASPDLDSVLTRIVWQFRDYS